MTKSKLMYAASGLSLLIGGGVAAQPAANQARTAAPDIETVVVTGTSIHGVKPIGQSLIEVGQKQIDETAPASMADLFGQTIPQLNSFGGANQQAGSYEPNLRSLGGLSSASTLVLVDGHRIPPGGNSFNGASDPNVVPVGAVQRIEVLPDGASAVYGSDAVAGVINIITRKNFDGLEVTGQSGFGSDYQKQSANLMFGRTWGTGSLLVSYGFNHASDLYGADRNFVSTNQSNSGPGATGRGGSNRNTYACSPATFIPGTGQPGAGLIFQSPYATGTGLANNPTVNGLCGNVTQTDLLPEVTSHRVFLTIRQDIGEDVKLSGTILYSTQNSLTLGARGTITTATVFGPGSTPAGGAGQINPFFQAPPGVTSGTVSFDFGQLLGGNSKSYNTTSSIGASVTADVALGHDWQASATLTAGQPTIVSKRVGAVCAVCAYRALNGTVSVNGSTTATSVVPLNLPLTSANALDVWNLTNNRTSATVLSGLTDSETYSNDTRPMYDAVVKADGPILDLPAGPLSVAVGGEYLILGRNLISISPGTTGPGSLASTYNDFKPSKRNVMSAFLEFSVPLISDEMGVPLINRLDLDIAGRIDHYSDLKDDFSTTENPRLGINWKPIADATIRASYSTSFTAPTVGQTALNDGSATYGDFFQSMPTLTLPQGFPNSAFLGCPAVGSCTLTSGSGRNGMVYSSQTNPLLRPQTGRNYSVGFDYAPSYLPGFKASVSYWHATYRGIITNLTSATGAAAIPGAEFLFTINPTAQQIADAIGTRRQNSTLNFPIAFIYSTANYNLFNVRGDGLDFDVSYTLPTDMGQFTFGAVGETKFNWSKQTAQGPWVNSTNIGNTANAFSPLSFTGRASVGWHDGPWGASVNANYVGSFYYTDATPAYAARPCPANVTANGLGCGLARDYLVIDASTQYTFPSDSIVGGMQVSLNIHNLFDQGPPFLNSINGYNLGAGSGATQGSGNSFADPIGRQITIGFRKDW